MAVEDARYGKVRLRAGHNLHPRLHGRGRWAGEGLPPVVRGSVIRVDVERLPKPSSRANNKLVWLWHWGPGKPDLELCLNACLHRFDLEHTYRFVKNTLGWTTSTPEQATAGPGSWSPATPSSAWPAASSVTYDCLGRSHATPPSLHQAGCGEGFLHFAQPSAHRPAHRNLKKPAPDGAKAPADRPVPATQSSRRPLRQPMRA